MNIVESRLPLWHALAALLAVTSACGSQGTDLNQQVGAGSDGGSAAQGNNPPPTPYQDPFGGAPAYARQGGGGDTAHNAGQACMQQGCHSSAGGHSEAPAFIIGGTVYQDYYGKVPAQGVEVRILDSNGNAASAYSDRGGSFYIRSGTNNVGFPAIVGARDANISRPMITTLSDPSMGSCGQSPCHVAGSSPMMGTYYPIHVP